MTQQMNDDIREAALGRLSAIHDDDMIEADPLPALGKGRRPACTWGFIRPPGAPGGKNVAQADFGADQDGAEVHQTALTRHCRCADDDAHQGSETADRHYEQENHHL
jgi:hypothetical protein